MKVVWQILRAGVFIAFGAAYLWLGYAASASSDPPLAGIIVGLAPLAFTAILLAWQSRDLWLQGLCLAVVAALVFNLDFLRIHTAWVYFIQHAGMHGMLGIMFGRTLFGRHEEALCSRVAAVVLRDKTDEAFFRYTWNLTTVWTVYFTVTTVTSAALFAAAPLQIWSVFANLLTPVFVAAIFGVEFIVRICVLPRNQRASIAHTVNAYREYAQRPRTR